MVIKPFLFWNEAAWALIFAIDPNDRKDWSRKEVFKNLDIKWVNVAVEGKPNQLYTSGLTTQYTYDQILKFLNHNTTVTNGEFLTTKYALVLDLRGSYDNGLHGNGLELRDEMTIEIKRIASGAVSWGSMSFSFRMLR